MRPNWEQYWKWFRRGGKVAAYLGFVASAVLTAIVTRFEFLVPIVVVVGSTSLALGCIAVSIKTSSIRLGNGRVEHRGWFVGTKVLSLDDDMRGLLAYYIPPESTHAPSELLVLRRGRKGSRILLKGEYWTHEDLEMIATYAGVPVTDEHLDGKGYEKRAPGVMRFSERTSFAWVYLIQLVVILVGAAVVGYFILAQS